jgi:NitT/TauT family transport system substrate-binding protein
MCDHHGGYAGTGSVSGSIDRRAFLSGGAAGAIVIGLPLGILGGAPSAQAAATFKGTHGPGFCNRAFFITHARQLGKEYGLTIEFVNTPTFAEMVTFFGAGVVDVSVLPYTSFIGQDRWRGRHRRLRDRRSTRARHAGEAQGQDARHLPDGYPRSAAL